MLDTKTVEAIERRAQELAQAAPPLTIEQGHLLASMVSRNVAAAGRTSPSQFEDGR